MKKNILVLDDNEGICSLFTRFLSRVGYLVETVSTLVEMDARLSSKRFDALVADVFLPDGKSTDRVSALRAEYPHLAIVLMTAKAGVDIAVKAMQEGADNFLCKPVDLKELDAFLRKGLEYGSLRRDAAMRCRQAKPKEPFFGKAAGWKKVLDLAQVAAENENVVLLLGETGVGKGVLARWIQRHGSRRGEPLVEINCSSLRGEMLASELFGHVKGAFTSAVQDKRGLVEVADGGTLFLDEIGDMDMAVQAQFLKVIEEKVFRRLGEIKDRRSDFRLICATNHDLEQLCEKGDFRRDLYFRIYTFPIHLPALREVKEDLSELVRHLLLDMGASHSEVSDEVEKTLLDYPWPGNIRELRNVLERALLLARGAPIKLEHLPGLKLTGPAIRSIPNTASLAELEQMKIRETMERLGGDTKKTAESLGISRATLYRRLSAMDAGKKKRL